MLSCLIIDDEPLAIQLLSDYVDRSPGLALAGAFTDAIEALQRLDDLSVDLIFLDIQMPDLTGIQFTRIIQGKYPVVFTTAYEDYALQGYELEVIDYLLKPVSFERFLQAVERARDRIDKSTGKRSEPGRPETDYLFVKSEYKTVKILLGDILYLESMGDYVQIFTPSERILTLKTLKAFEQSLPEVRFLRVHKSFIVALDKIDYVEKSRIVIGQVRIPLGSTYQDRFWKRIGEKE